MTGNIMITCCHYLASISFLSFLVAVSDCLGSSEEQIRQQRWGGWWQWFGSEWKTRRSAADWCRV